jgi:hypothetical protein
MSPPDTTKYGGFLKARLGRGVRLDSLGAKERSGSDNPMRKQNDKAPRRFGEAPLIGG